MKFITIFSMTALVGMVGGILAFLNEIIYRSIRDSALLYPIERTWSFERVALNLVVGVAAAVWVLRWWYLKSEDPERIRLPSLPAVILLSLMGMAAGVFVTSIFSLGWCCDSPAGLFFGFPFSWGFGEIGFDQETALAMRQLPAYRQLFASPVPLKWSLHIIKSVMNLLFWFNSSVLIVMAVDGIRERFRARGRLPIEMGG